MTVNFHRWGWEGVSARDPESWVPVFGKWCGPGWSAGERIKTIEDKHKEVGVAIDPDTDRKSPIDELCKIHDFAYQKAKGKPDEIEQKLRADLILLKSLAALNQDELTQQEKQYFCLMELYFEAKTRLRRLSHPELTAKISREEDEEDAKWRQYVLRVAMAESADMIRNYMKAFNSGAQVLTKHIFSGMLREIERELAAIKKRKKITLEQKKQFPIQEKTNNSPEHAFSRQSVLTEQLFDSRTCSYHKSIPEKQNSLAQKPVGSVSHSKSPTDDEPDSDFVLNQISSAKNLDGVVNCEYKTDTESLDLFEECKLRSRNYV